MLKLFMLNHLKPVKTYQNLMCDFVCCVVTVLSYSTLIGEVSLG